MKKSSWLLFTLTVIFCSIPVQATSLEGSFSFRWHQSSEKTPPQTKAKDLKLNSSILSMPSDQGLSNNTTPVTPERGNLHTSLTSPDQKNPETILRPRISLHRIFNNTDEIDLDFFNKFKRDECFKRIIFLTYLKQTQDNYYNANSLFPTIHTSSFFTNDKPEKYIDEDFFTKEELAEGCRTNLDLFLTHIKWFLAKSFYPKLSNYSKIENFMWALPIDIIAEFILSEHHLSHYKEETQIIIDTPYNLTIELFEKLGISKENKLYQRIKIVERDDTKFKSECFVTMLRNAVILKNHLNHLEIPEEITKSFNATETFKLKYKNNKDSIDTSLTEYAVFLHSLYRNVYLISSVMY